MALACNVFPEKMRILCTEGLSDFLNSPKVQKIWFATQRALKSKTDVVHAPSSLYKAMGGFAARSCFATVGPLSISAMTGVYWSFITIFFLASR